MAEPVVVLQNVGKVFHTARQDNVALRDVNLTVRPGEFVTVIGPSGCGKSTLLRIVGDLLPPTTGAVRVNDKNARQARLAREYGIVFQSPVLFDWRTVRANIELPLEVMQVPRAERERRADEMLGRVELREFAAYYPWQLSGGMQQRVAIARALVLRPSLLLMDEPFGSLDELTRDRLNGELLALWQATGTTVLFVTHSIPEAVFLSTRVAVMAPRPGHIADIVEIDLPQPRGWETREVPHYFELSTRLREALHRSSEPGNEGG